MARRLLIGLVAVCTVILLRGPAQAQMNTESVRSFIASIVSTLASGEGSRVEIAEIEGSVLSDFTIGRVTVADREGVWLTAERVRIVWSPWALIRRRLDVEQAQIARIAMARRPVPVAAAAKPSAGGTSSPPAFRIARFGIEEFVLDGRVIGQAARITASGSFQFLNPAAGFEARFAARRTDGPEGRIEAAIRYAPEGRTLSITLDAAEGEGGLFAHLLGADALPALRAQIRGDGTWEDWSGSALVEAGAEQLLQADARIQKTEDDHLGTFSLRFGGGRLFPGVYAEVVAGGTAEIRVRVGPDTGVRIEQFDVAAGDASLVVDGSMGPNFGALDLRYALRGGSRRIASLIDSALSWQDLRLTGTATGSGRAPKIEASLALEQLAMAGHRAASVTMDLTATGQDAAGGLRFDLSARGSAAGLSVADPALAALPIRSAAWTVTGVVDPNGQAALTALTLDLGDARVAFSGRVDPMAARGELALRRLPLAMLSPLAGRPLEGDVTATADLDVAFDGSRAALRLRGNARDLKLGQPLLDTILGGRLDVAGAVQRTANGVFTFRDLTLDGAHAAATIDGTAGPRGADLRAMLRVAELARLNPHISQGRAAATLRLQGSLREPRIEGDLEILGAEILGRSIERVALSVRGRRAGGRLAGGFTATGRLDGRPLEGGATLSETAAGDRIVNALHFSLGSMRLTGDLRITPQNLVEGSVDFRAGQLSDIAALVLVDISGRLEAELRFSIENGAQAMRIAAGGSDLLALGARIAALNAEISVSGARGVRTVLGTVTARGIVAGGTAVPSATVRASGTADDLRIAVSSTAAGVAIEAGARMDFAAAQPSVRLVRLEMVKGRQSIRLAAPATFTLAPEGVRFDRVMLAGGSGTAVVTGRATDPLDLRLAIRNFPIGLARLAAPGLEVDGTLSGTVTVGGTTAAPVARYDLTITQLRAEQIRVLGAGPFQVTARGTATQGRVDVEARITGRGGATAAVTGRIPLVGPGLALRIAGRFDLGLANTALGATSMRVSGPVVANLEVSGSLAVPTFTGTVQLTGGQFEDPVNGLQFRNVSLTARATQRELTLATFSAASPNGGPITGSGTVSLDPAAGFPANLTFRAEKALLVSSDTVSAVADAQLTVTGPLTGSPLLAGRLDVQSVDVTVPDRLPGAATMIDVRHVNVPPQLRPYLPQPQPRAPAPSAARDIRLDVAVSAPVRVFVRGRGVDAELGGAFTVRGSTARPVVDGALALKRGTLELLGKRLTFSRGRLDFPGTLDPRLDFVAEARDEDVLATVTVTGTASDPKIVFASTPELPQDEILARVLFGRPTTELTKGQAIQLAQAAAQLAGSGGGVLDRVRRRLGVDTLDVGTDASGAPQVGVSRRVHERIDLGVSQGTTTDSSRGRVTIDLTPNIRLKGEVGADGATSIGIGAEWNY